MEQLTFYADWVAILFIIGYLAVVIEEFLHLNKSATALFMAIACWTVLFLEPKESIEKHLGALGEEMFKVTQVLFFLLGALIIVEIINTHKGFAIITRVLRVSSKKKLFLLVGLFTFFLSSVLDNLTTTIVMVSIGRKLLENREERLLLGGSVVVAANAGGAWTPIGDVATTLLWISGELTAFPIIRDLFLPSLACLFTYLLLDHKNFKGTIELENRVGEEEKTEPYGTLILCLGIASLIFVPVFRALTGLPPFFGMMLGVGILWYATDLLHYKYPERWHLRVTETLPKVDISVILFYLGILLSIFALESAKILEWLGNEIAIYISSPKIIPVLVGLASSVIDNVSLVAAAIGMYGLKSFGIDSEFWQLMAYCAGTGGSILIIGSAAGVAFMSIEKADFLWYLKNVSLKATLAYFSGIVIYILIYSFV